MLDPSHVRLGFTPELEFIKAFIALVESFSDSRRQIVDANRALRLELYKMTYLSGTFELYQKSDAGEAFQQILTFLHSPALNI